MKMNLKLTALAAVMAMVIVPMTANAKKYHPTSNPDTTVDSCTCDEWVWVDSTDIVLGHWSSECDVQWTAEDATGLAYGASIEYEAEWMVEETDMSGESETEVEDDAYSCMTGDYDGEGDDADEQCSAEDVAVTAPVVGDPAIQSFELRVKGFYKDSKGRRDFVKDTGSCAPMPPVGMPDPV